MARLGISRYLAFLRHDGPAAEARHRQGAGVPVNTILPEAQARFTDAVATINLIIDDIAADEAARGLPAQAQALIDRKRVLIAQKRRPCWTACVFIDDTLIVFQQERRSGRPRRHRRQPASFIRKRRTF